MNTDDQPATLHDLDTWGGQLTQRIDQVEEKLGSQIYNVREEMQDVRAELQDVKDIAKTILEVVQTTNRDVRALRDLPERVEQLEEDVLKLQTKQ